MDSATLPPAPAAMLIPSPEAADFAARHRAARDMQDPTETSLAYRETYEREQDDIPRADTAEDLC